MQRLVVLVVIATAGAALAKPALKTFTQGKSSVGVPDGYKAVFGERCLAMDGAGSLNIFRTETTQADFEKAEKGKKVGKDKVVCFEQSAPGETARCLVTTDSGRWVAQFVAFGKAYSKLGGADAIGAIVASIKGWAPAAYKGTYSEGNDCPPVPM